MPISKALRFEVLRRDGFACTYCGRRPPDIELHIDHVNRRLEQLHARAAEIADGGDGRP